MALDRPEQFAPGAVSSPRKKKSGSGDVSADGGKREADMAGLALALFFPQSQVASPEGSAQLPATSRPAQAATASASRAGGTAGTASMSRGKSASVAPADAAGALQARAAAAVAEARARNAMARSAAMPPVPRPALNWLIHSLSPTVFFFVENFILSPTLAIGFRRPLLAASSIAILASASLLGFFASSGVMPVIRCSFLLLNREVLRYTVAPLNFGCVYRCCFC